MDAAFPDVLLYISAAAYAGINVLPNLPFAI
jgi:hypothetical protein